VVVHVEYLLADALTIASGVHLGAVAEVEPDRLHHRAPPRLAGIVIVATGNGVIA